MFIDTMFGGTFGTWMAPLIPSQKAFYLYLMSAFVMAGASWLYFSYREQSARPEGVSKGFLGYVFDKGVWLHRSARQDYMYFVLNALIYYGIVAQLLIAGHIFFGVFESALEAVFGLREVPVFASSPLTAATRSFSARKGAAGLARGRSRPLSSLRSWRQRTIA